MTSQGHLSCGTLIFFWISADTRDDTLIALHLSHIEDSPNAVALLHNLKSVVDLAQLLPVRDELIDLELALEVILDKVRQLRTALDTAERAALPLTTRHKLEC